MSSAAKPDPLAVAGVADLDDAALQAQIKALMPLVDKDALVDPLSLAMHLDSRVVSRPHLRVISSALAGLSPSAGDRVLITTPPQVGKTNLAIWGVFWWMCRYPMARTIIGSYGTMLATKRGRAIRKLVQSHGGRYGLSLEQGIGAAHDWSLTTGGGVRSAGIGAGITGEPADFGLIDDPVKGRVEADSPAIRNKTWDWWSGDFTSRLAPGAPVLLVMTRWSDDDLAARLLAEEGTVEEGGRWRVLAMPAIAVEADPAHGVYPDALGREPGEPLSHPRVPTSDRARLLRHWSDKRRSSTARDWGALYMGSPRPVEGALVDREILRRRRVFKYETVALRKAVAVDPSGGGKDTAGIIAGFLGADRRCYLTHDLSGRMPTQDWSRKACLLAHETGADRIIVEKNYGGDIALLTVRSAWQALVDEGTIPADQLPPMVIGKSVHQGKLLRAEPIAQQIILGNVLFGAPLPELEEEWATWSPASSAISPGRIDASALLVKTLLPIASIQAIAGTVTSASKVSRRAASGSGAAGMPSRARVVRSNVFSLDVLRRMRAS